jgi:hypothetical protein
LRPSPAAVAANGEGVESNRAPDAVRCTQDCIQAVTNSDLPPWFKAALVAAGTILTRAANPADDADGAGSEGSDSQDVTS